MIGRNVHVSPNFGNHLMDIVRKISRRQAETIALQALSYIFDDEELLGGFLGWSGAAPDDIRANAGNPEFLGFILEFLMQEESLLVAFARQVGLPPDSVARARAALPGGDAPHWT